MAGFSLAKIQGLIQNNRFMKFIILLIKNISPDIFVMALPITWQQTLSLLLIFPVFTMLAITPRSISPPCKLVLAVSCILYIGIREILHGLERIGFKLGHICNCITKRSVVQNYTKYSCQNLKLLTTNKGREHQNKAPWRARKERMSALTSQDGGC